jgi:hypothetical protein
MVVSCNFVIYKYINRRTCGFFSRRVLSATLSLSLSLSISFSLSYSLSHYVENGAVLILFPAAARFNRPVVGVGECLFYKWRPV